MNGSFYPVFLIFAPFPPFTSHPLSQVYYHPEINRVPRGYNGLPARPVSWRRTVIFFPFDGVGQNANLMQQRCLLLVGRSGLNGLLLCVGLSDKQHSVSKSFVCAVY